MLTTDERIWEMARGFQGSRVLLTAVELGVFGALGEGPRSSEQVASAIGADKRATDRLMNALVVLGLLVKQGDTFSNSPDAGELLVPGKPEYAGGALMHVANMWDSWSTLTRAVKTGTSVLEREGPDRQKWVKPFIAAMHYIAGGQAREIVGLIDLGGVRRVLDVGGGSGAYAIEFCRANPDLEVVVFDLPDVVSLTGNYVREAGLSGRITTTAGDYNADELGREFDLAFVSAILHANGPDENVELFKKCRRALRTGGRIVVQDFIIEDDRTSPPFAALFALNMLVATAAGDTYTEAEVMQWLSAASFGDTRRIDPPTAETTLLVSRAE